jgi:Ca-activated chloride channel family protein
MAAVHRRIGNPVLEGVNVQLPSMSPRAGTTTPDGPADVFPGVPLVVAGRYGGEPAGRAMVTAQGAAAAVTLEAPITVVNNRAADAVWARAHLRDLEDRYAAAGPGADLDKMAAHIVAVSVRHRVLCRFTAFVAVDESGQLVGGEAHRITQPVELPLGWSPMAVGGPMRFAARPMAAGAGPRGDQLLLGDTLPSVPNAASPVPPVPAHAGVRFTPAEVPIDLEAYAARCQELLDALKAFSTGRAWPGRLVFVASARVLAGDLRSVGGSDELVRVLEAVAEAFDAGDLDAVAVWTEELRRLLAGGRGRRGWWRR